MPDISVMVEAGKATAAAPLGPALGPMGVNIGEVVAQINAKTKGYAGMKVPVKVKIDAATKAFEIEIGSPPTSALIKKELNIEKGAANPRTEVVGNLSMGQVKKLAEMKMGNLNSYTLKKAAREIIGVCNSMGVTVEGEHAKLIQRRFDKGEFDGSFPVEEGDVTVATTTPATQPPTKKPQEPAVKPVSEAAPVLEPAEVSKAAPEFEAAEDTTTLQPQPEAVVGLAEEETPAEEDLPSVDFGEEDAMDEPPAEEALPATAAPKPEPVAEPVKQVSAAPRRDPKIAVHADAKTEIYRPDTPIKTAKAKNESIDVKMDPHTVIQRPKKKR